MMLKVDALNTYYGASHVLFDLSLDVQRGEIVCLLGRNGAGKTTTMRSIMGLTKPRSGRVILNEVDITNHSVHRRARVGLGFVPDDRWIFPTLTVRENLELAAKSPAGSHPVVWTLDSVFRLFPKLGELETHLGGNLSGGEQQMLAIARTLMGSPTVLLMDEPAEGLSPLIVQSLVEQFRSLKAAEQTILLSEQNLPFALSVSDRAYVIEKGTIRFSGSIRELQADDEVKRRYLMV